MAGAPHDKTGRTCSKCNAVFTKHSFVGTITRLRPATCTFDGETKTRDYQIPALLCRACLNEHYAKGEV